MKRRRNTRQRQLVLDAVRSRCDHPSADQIYLAVRAVDEKISRGTVYRNLKVLVRQDKVLQVKLPGIDRFEAQSAKHYHLTCTKCGAIKDLPSPYREDLDEQAAKKTGYVIDRHRTLFEGVCPNCQKNSTQKD